MSSGNMTKRLQPSSRHKRLEKRINAMYTDKLDGRISTEFFDKMSEQLREEQSQCLKNIELRQGAERSYMRDSIELLDLAVNAKSMFETQEIRSKRQLFKSLLSNSQLKGHPQKPCLLGGKFSSS